MEYVDRACKYCKEDFKIQIVSKGKRKGELKRDQKFCSNQCKNDWLKDTSWEDIIGHERANEIRQERSEQVSGNKNPSCDPIVAKKISESLKKTLSENPEMRKKENNGFYGKSHTDEYKLWASESRIGKRAYDKYGYERLKMNTLKLDLHPNWQGGVSYEEYDYSFSPKMKEDIKIRDNHECQICMSTNDQLHIHHIDYNKQNSTEENLITLCNSCHSKTNWQRESWIEFFKPIMKQKYSS